MTACGTIKLTQNSTGIGAIYLAGASAMSVWKLAIRSVVAAAIVGSAMSISHAANFGVMAALGWVAMGTAAGLGWAALEWVVLGWVAPGCMAMATAVLE
jgi:hypothetical protein